MRTTIKAWVVAVVGVAMVATAASAADYQDDMREMREMVLKLQDQVQAQQHQIDDQQVVMQEAGLEDERGSKSALSSFLESTDFNGWVAASYFYNTNVWIGRRKRWAGAIAGLLLLAAGIAAPQLFLAITTPERAVLAELPAAAPGAPDVVLIVLDTVRAESMSAYGYERETTPRFDALAREGALYRWQDRC